MRRFIIVILLSAMSMGCSSFRQTTHLDFKPFAEYTITLAADIEYGLSRSKIHYLREFHNDPVLVNHGEMWNGVRMILKGVVAYSVEVTTLGSSTSGSISSSPRSRMPSSGVSMASISRSKKPSRTARSE